MRRSAASLSFHHDELDPAEITESLGLEPTRQAMKGQTFRTAPGTEKVAYRGTLLLDTPRCSPADLDGQMQHLLGGSTADTAIWRRLSERYGGVIGCGLFMAQGNEGIRIQPRTLLLAGERGLPIDFDIYDGECSGESVEPST